MQITSKFPSRCRECGGKIAAGYKVDYVRDRGIAHVACARPAAPATSAPPALPPVGPASPPAKLGLRSIDGLGNVRMGYDPDALPLLRALPGARFDRDAKAWTCSVADGDLPRVLEISAKLGLEVSPKLTERMAAVKARAEILADGLYPFQVEAVGFMANRTQAILGSEMGCIDGDATVRVNRAGKGFELRLVDLHHRFHGGHVSGSRWNPSIPTKIRALCDGVYRQHEVRDVLDKGVRPVVKLTLASGKTLRLTPDHEVAGPGDTWIEAAKLSPGDQVLTNGQPACPICKTTENLSTYAYAKFRGYCRKCIARYMRRHPTFIGGEHPDKDGYVRVSGQFDHPRAVANNALKHHLVMEAHLGRHLRPNETVHHRNGIKDDNRLENLELMTVSEHATHHGREGGFLRLNGAIGGRGGRVVFVPVIDTVVSVEPDGEAHVYDVVCADPHRNFVANGVVVHNCGKTVMALRSLPANAPVLVVCPNSLKLNWCREAERWAPAYRTEALSGRGSFRWPAPGELLAINYDILPATDKLADAPDAPAGLVLICDEVHFAKSYKAQRSKRVQKLAELAGAAGGRVWGLTGTPLTNRPPDLWGVLSSLKMDRTVFGSYYKFRDLFGGRKNRWGGTEWAPQANVEAAERLRRVMIRHLRKDVLPQLPPKTYRDLEVNGLDKGLSSRLDAFAERLGDDGLPSFEEFSAIRAELAASRIPALLEQVEAFEDADEPLVVFSAHRAPIDALASREGWAVITGDVSVADRQAAVDAFQSGRLKGIALTIGAGGTGLTLTRACNMIFVDLDWVPANNAQAEDRCVRIGQQSQKVTITRMVSPHPLDQHVHALLAEKIALIHSAVDAEAPEVAAKPDAPVAVPDGKPGPRPPVSPELRAAVRESLEILCGSCDGARKRDDAGFNRLDAPYGRYLAQLPELSDGHVRAAARMMRKYKRQIGVDLAGTLASELAG